MNSITEPNLDQTHEPKPDELIRDTFKSILKAHIYDAIEATPMSTAFELSEKTGHTIRLKREDKHPVYSFKIRGAYNFIKKLPDEVRKHGLVCVSAGNHGQGVGFAARHFNVQAMVVMPLTTPKIKVDAVSRLGATTVLHGDTYQEAAEFGQSLAQEHHMTFVHPFDTLDVIAGQGTVGKEIYEHEPEADYVFVPVGGGGLLAGVATYLKTINPQTKIIGVEPFDSAGMTTSIRNGKLTELHKTGTFADGAAVKQVGKITFGICQALVDDFITVSNDEICAAIENCYQETRTIFEPSGALAYAGCKKYLQQHHELKNKKVVVIMSGANMNFQRLQFIAERSLTGSYRESLYAIRLPEQSGALSKLCTDVIHHRSITEFNYRYSDKEEAFIFLGIENSSLNDAKNFEKHLLKRNYVFFDLTHNDLAKDHIRHMVGGRSNADDEIVCRFEFPERPGALKDFLDHLGGRWNISMFHYRSHGSDYNRVLIGLQVPEPQNPDFMEFLRTSPFESSIESSNPAYKLFLA